MNNGTKITLLSVAALAAGVAFRRGSPARKPRVYLVGGNRKMTPGTIRKLQNLGVSVTGSVGEGRTGRAPRSQGDVDAILVLANASTSALSEKARALAREVGVPLLRSTTGAAEIEQALVRAGLLTAGSRNSVKIPSEIERRLVWHDQALSQDGFVEIDGNEVYRHEFVEWVLTELFGRHVGLNADWSIQAWYLGSGPPNSTSGDYYVIMDEPDDDLSIVQRFYFDDEDNDGQDEIESVQEFGDNLRGLVQHILDNRRHYRRVQRRSLRGLRSPPARGSAYTMSSGFG